MVTLSGRGLWIEHLYVGGVCGYNSCTWEGLVRKGNRMGGFMRQVIDSWGLCELTDGGATTWAGIIYVYVLDVSVAGRGSLETVRQLLLSH